MVKSFYKKYEGGEQKMSQTIPQVVESLLSKYPEGLSIKQITQIMLDDNLYEFKTKDPKNVVSRAIKRHCTDVKEKYVASEMLFTSEQTRDRGLIYKLMNVDSIIVESETTATNTKTTATKKKFAEKSVMKEVKENIPPFSFPREQVRKINSATDAGSTRSMQMVAKNQNIRKLLKDYCFCIPDYQRGYSWKAEQINEFLDDLYNIVQGDSSNIHHFLGAITMSKNQGNGYSMNLIDGQQRITTTFILLYVVLEYYKSDRFVSVAKRRADGLYRALVYLNDDGELIDSRLVLGKFNASFFEEFVIKGHSLPDDEKAAIVKKYRDRREFTENQHIFDAYNLIKLSIGERLGQLSDSDAYEYLKALHIAMFDYFEVVLMILEDEADAFLIFETMNDRGLALSAVDLIKNKLFQIFATRPLEFDDLKADWDTICRNIDKKEDLTKFILHYWRSKIEYTTMQSLYKTCRDYLSCHDFETAKMIVKELKDESIYYNGFCNPKGNYPWRNEGLKNLLEDINKLRYDLIRPILLAGWRNSHGDEDYLYDIARLCMNFMIRYISVLNYKPSSIEKDLSNWARDKDFSLELLINRFTSKATDNEFFEKLCALSIPYTSPLTHYLLCVYESEGFGRKEIWTTPGRGENTVEHVLPQTVKVGKDGGDYWIDQFGSLEQCDLYCSRLGNYAFLTKRAQGKASNKEFGKKKAIYEKETDMLLTKELCEFVEWNPLNIAERQKRMAKVLLRYISFK